MNRVIGLKEDEAVKFINKFYHTPRVTCRDADHYILTRDYKTDRVNLMIYKGKVKEAYKG